MDSAAIAGRVLRKPTQDIPYDEPVGVSPWIGFSVLCFLSAISFLTLDHRLSGFLKAHRYKGEFYNLFQAAEHFGTFHGALLILVSMALILPSTRRRISRIAVAAITAGLLADVGKLLVTRLRPDIFEFSLPIQDSITGFLMWGAGGSRYQSFPSAHTAFAVAFAVLLGDQFPRARLWFLFLATMVAAQRILSTAHYPSDTFAGAAVGWMIGCVFLGPSPISRLYDRLEHRYFPLTSVDGVLEPSSAR